MDGKDPNNTGGIIFPLRVNGHGKFMGYPIIIHLQSFKETHPLMAKEDIYAKRMTMNYISVFDLPCIETPSHVFYSCFLKFLKDFSMEVVL